MSASLRTPDSLLGKPGAGRMQRRHIQATQSPKPGSRLAPSEKRSESCWCFAESSGATCQQGGVTRGSVAFCRRTWGRCFPRSQPLHRLTRSSPHLQGAGPGFIGRKGGLLHVAGWRPQSVFLGILLTCPYSAHRPSWGDLLLPFTV